MLAEAGGTPRTQSTTRDPAATRQRLLECAFDEIYEKGYAGASLDRILADSGVTKGALYHHFASKAELAVALIDELILPILLKHWVEPIRTSDDPVSALIEVAHPDRVTALSERYLTCGCPLNNLAQELCNADERFRTHIDRAFDRWRSGLAEAFARGQQLGTVREDVDPDGVAAFVVAGIEGLATTMKSSRDMKLTGSAAAVLFQFLETLRPSTAEPAA